MAPLRHIAAALAILTPTLAQQLKALTYVGCFKSSNGLTQTENQYQYQSDGHCQEVCVTENDGAPVLGLSNGNQCFCGTQTPNAGDKVDDSSCNSPCTGYGQHMCGGDGFYSVYLTGTQNAVSAVGGSPPSGSSNTPSSTVSGVPQVVTSIAPGKTVVVTQAPSTADSPAPSPAPGKSNTTAIVAGVVVGVVVLLALAGAAFFFIRHRRRRAAVDEYKTHQVSDFMAGGKPTIPAMGKSSPSGPDSRFDAEAMAHRRLSDGSIADNEDYSRRILKVTNPGDDRH